MTKSDFVFAVAERSGLTKKDAELAAGAVFDVLTQIMAQGDRLQFPGFGTFKTRVRPPFVGRHPNPDPPCARCLPAGLSTEPPPALCHPCVHLSPLV